MILGFDISTRYIGWCILDDSGRFVDIGHLDLTKEEDFYAKVDSFCSLFSGDIMWGHKYYTVFVEEPVKMFKSNASMAQTIALLQRFNAACCYEIYKILGTKPTLIMEPSARKKAGIKVPKGVKGKDKKKFVLEHIQSLGVVPENKWVLKRTGNPKDWCFDQADAFVVALAGVQMNVSE